MRYPLLRRARKQDHPRIPDVPLLGPEHDAQVRELVLAARLDDMPARVWLAPLEVIAMEHAEAAGYRWTGNTVRPLYYRDR